MKRTINIFKIIIYCLLFISLGCKTTDVKQSFMGFGWSKNSINTVKFRKNALTTFQNYQFTAYYDNDGFLVLGKRKLNSENWEILKTVYKGNIIDAHNSISIAIDGDGILHVSWDHHNTRLRYAKSKRALSLELGDEMAMSGQEELKVTYPEFYNLPNGNLLFFYRSGASGKGNMVINSYSIQSQKWTQIHKNLIDGEDVRSAYWQSCIDNQGVIHLSWIWRESWDVATNHDLCYAKSKDGGISWEKSTGESYNLPINAANAEYAWKIPQDSNLMNQAAMTTDKKGNPLIVSYWNEADVPQFQLVYLENGIWKKESTQFRKTVFNLAGGGTKQIPISRPDILIDENTTNRMVYLLFRDEERGNKISLAYRNLKKNTKWNVNDLTKTSVGQWEPNYDINLWTKKKILNVFVQNVSQVDGEGLTQNAPTKVSVLQINKLPK